MIGDLLFISGLIHPDSDGEYLCEVLNDDSTIYMTLYYFDNHWHLFTKEEVKKFGFVSVEDMEVKPEEVIRYIDIRIITNISTEDVPI